jgi:ATP-dependent DNA helicase RecG
MTPADFNAKLNELVGLPNETEWVEFKHNDLGEETYHDIGEYLSAIANSLALIRKDRGYILWGIDNQTHEMLGTDFRPRNAKVGNEELENWLTRGLHPQVRFWIHEASIESKHFVLMEISATTHTPVRFYGEEYIRVGSLKKRLRDYPEKERELWAILQYQDWSAEICEGATLDDLELDAILAARDEYKEKNPNLANEVDGWDNATFLNKAKLCINGQITRTAIILLGKAESEHYISPSVAKISWILKDDKGVEQDYQHFGPPFLLNVDAVFNKVRNLTYRYMQNQRLFPTEVSQYDPWVMREALHNCIAHQDYTLCGGIVLVEEPGSLLMTNYGSFIPGSVEAVIRRDAPEARYRNRFLADAMVNLKMIDTIGSGIRRMFDEQRKRFFPLPDYDFSEPDRIKVRLFGKVIDEKYTRMLMSQTDLDLFDVIALDKVQKKMPLTDDEFKSLKSKQLAEGRRPNLFVSAKVAVATESKADYIKKRAFDKEHYKKMIEDYLEKFGETTREEIDKLILDKLSDALTEKQKRNMIMNLLQEMRRTKMIIPIGGKRGKGAKWGLHKPAS